MKLMTQVLYSFVWVILFMITLIGCTQYEQDNPLDAESKNFNDSLYHQRLDEYESKSGESDTIPKTDPWMNDITIIGTHALGETVALDYYKCRGGNEPEPSIAWYVAEEEHAGASVVVDLSTSYTLRISEELVGHYLYAVVRCNYSSTTLVKTSGRVAPGQVNKEIPSSSSAPSLESPDIPMSEMATPSSSSETVVNLVSSTETAVLSSQESTVSEAGQCGDDLDNDNDDLVDCLDSDCDTAVECRLPEKPTGFVIFRVSDRTVVVKFTHYGTFYDTTLVYGIDKNSTGTIDSAYIADYKEASGEITLNNLENGVEYTLSISVKNRFGNESLPLTGKIIANQQPITQLQAYKTYNDGVILMWDNPDELLSVSISIDALSKQVDSSISMVQLSGISAGQQTVSVSTTGIQWGTSEVTEKQVVIGGTDTFYFIDSRDSTLYTQVKIGDQLWMSENLAYVTPTSQCFDYCSQNKTRYYTWADAMNGSDSSSTNPSSVQGRCPEGWHLPSFAEVDEIGTFTKSADAGVTYNPSLLSWQGLGLYLKGDEGWRQNGGNDIYGFNGQGDGYYNSSGMLNTHLDDGFWWSTTQQANQSSGAYLYRLTSNTTSLNYTELPTETKAPIRCVKDLI